MQSGSRIDLLPRLTASELGRDGLGVTIDPITQCGCEEVSILRVLVRHHHHIHTMSEIKADIVPLDIEHIPARANDWHPQVSRYPSCVQEMRSKVAHLRPVIAVKLRPHLRVETNSGYSGTFEGVWQL